LTRSFSVNRYGEEEAKQLAIQARMSQLEQVDGMHCFSRDLPAMIARLGRARVKTGGVGAREAEAPDRLGVTRVRAGAGGPGWKACASWNGKTLEKRFLDQRLGGRKAALMYALGWRDRMTNPRSKSITIAEFSGIRRSSNTSGVAGVSRASRAEIRRDGTIAVRHYWLARTPAGGGRYKTSYFRIEKYGEEEAYRRAVKVRLQKLAELTRPLRGHQAQVSVVHSGGRASGGRDPHQIPERHHGLGRLEPQQPLDPLVLQPSQLVPGEPLLRDSERERLGVVPHLHEHEAPAALTVLVHGPRRKDREDEARDWRGALDRQDPRSPARSSKDAQGPTRERE
jgi:hypothetical protein